MELFKKSEGTTSLPNRLLGKEFKNVQNAAAIKAILYVYLKAPNSYVSLNDLLSDRAFISFFKDVPEAKKALAEAVVGRFILALPVGDDTYYFAATEESYENFLKTQGKYHPAHSLNEAKSTPNIYELYEANIGILTPLIAQELERLEAEYPYSWIEEAVKEAVLQNKRSLKYIIRILENRAQNTLLNNNTRGEYSQHVKWQ